MLQGRLNFVVGLVIPTTLMLAACGDKTIENNVVRPGITAIEQSKALACSGDAEALRSAIESYQLLEGKPPADEAALVTAGYLREESTVWDLKDGQLVAVAPDCVGMAPRPTTVPADTTVSTPGLTAPATDVGQIVTGTEAPQTADEVFAGFTADQIARIGGTECARQLAQIFAAGERYAVERGTSPKSLDDLYTAGYLDQPITLWINQADQLVPSPGSGCNALG